MKMRMNTITMIMIKLNNKISSKDRHKILDLANNHSHFQDIILQHYSIYNLVFKILEVHPDNPIVLEEQEIVISQENIEEHVKIMDIFPLKSAVIMVVVIEEMKNPNVIDQEEPIKLNQEIMVKVQV